MASILIGGAAEAGGADGVFQRRHWLIAVSVAVALAVPSAVWIAIDRSPFGGDQSEYATRTLILFRTLVESPPRWAMVMATGEGFRPPGIEWLGQLFVPLGYLIGSIDKALLSSILAVQVVSLMLLFRTIWEITRDTSLAVLGVTVLAAAPLFVGSSQNYMVEPLQLLAVTWSLLIMVRARHWPRSLIVGQVVAVGTLAALAKSSSPLYCFVPLAVALTEVWRPSPARSQGRSRTAIVWTLVPTVPLSVAAFTWYLHNYQAVFAHAAGSSIGAGAAAWGKLDTFTSTLLYWLDVLHKSLFSPAPVRILALGGLAAFALGAVVTRTRVRDSRRGLYWLVVALQLALPLAAFALASNRLHRVVVPLLPYGAVLVCLILAAVNNRIATGLIATLVAGQFMLIHAQKLDLVRPSRQTMEFVRRIDRDGRSARTIESIVARTCREGDHDVINVLAIAPGFKNGDWLAPVPANYVVRKQRPTGTAKAPCDYLYAGNSFFGSSAAEAWNHIDSTRARYVIIADPAVYAPAPNAMNQSLNRENAPVLLDHLTNAGRFKPPVRLPEDPGILLFERDILAKLSPRGASIGRTAAKCAPLFATQTPLEGRASPPPSAARLVEVPCHADNAWASLECPPTEAPRHSRCD